ncbi:MAB_1171c family putative transporter [Streptomyces qinzhouensis]|uniref:MAB_1171c family putative transporter n=1 Tax=Streptomyces qinzhouensis TaxID=2599401 RepID=UPI00164895F0|nr:MAB_1171c family putative transporter [Streptomyces qinzhouensis]
MRSTDYYLPAAALTIAFAAKLPSLRHNWRDPLVRCVCFLVFTAAICFFFAAPPTITAVNRITGVPNFSGPLVYVIMGSFSCACLVLVVNWRGGPEDRVRRSSRAWLALYAVVITALPVLFALGDAPVERLRDLDTYYATTPYIREMIVTYLGAHLVSAVVTTWMCLRWARAVTGWLRAGLIVLVAGFGLNLAFAVTKLSAVVARWTGRDWDHLSTTVAPPIVALGGFVVTCGFLLPLVGPRLGALAGGWTAYLRLGRLWKLLNRTRGDADTAFHSAVPWWADADMRLTVRETGIHDALLRLHPRLDDGVRRRALAAVAAAPSAVPAETAGAMAIAAMIRHAAAVPDSGDPAPDLPGDGAGADALAEFLGPGRRRLLLLSKILTSSAVTAALSVAPEPPARPESRSAS